MIRHVVMWRFKPEDKQKNMARLKAMLEALPAQIPQIRDLRAGVHDNPGAAGWDMALVADFDSAQDMKAYQSHPAHKAVSSFCAGIRTDRALVDFTFET